MEIKETRKRTLLLDIKDIKQAIVMYLKERGERVDDNDIILHPSPLDTSAEVTIIETLEPKKE